MKNHHNTEAAASVSEKHQPNISVMTLQQHQGDNPSFTPVFLFDTKDPNKGRHRRPSNGQSHQTKSAIRIVSLISINGCFEAAFKARNQSSSQMSNNICSTLTIFPRRHTKKKKRCDRRFKCLYFSFSTTGLHLVPSFPWLLWGIGKYHSRNRYLFPYDMKVIIGLASSFRLVQQGSLVRGWFEGRCPWKHDMCESCGRLFSTTVGKEATATTVSLVHLTAEIHLIHVLTSGRWIINAAFLLSQNAQNYVRSPLGA